MNGKRIGLVLLGAAGLWLYLWPAFRAPVVLWADGRVDMRWAREGTGLWKPLTAEEAGRLSMHALKPGYLLYLRLAMSAVPGASDGRSVVVVQSVLLWLSISAASLALARRRGAGAGTAAYVLILLFVPLRDAASSVGPEAISAALFLMLAAAALVAPERRWSAVAIGIGLAALFWVRPNVGGIALVLVVAGWILAGRLRAALAAGAVCVALVLGLWAATKPRAGPDPSRALFDAILFGTAEYDWGPSLGEWPRPPGEPAGVFSDRRLVRAAANWRRTLSLVPADRGREIRWRAGHGLLGLEYYDARWSAAYRAIDHALRLVAPFLVLACAAAALAMRRGAPHRSANAAAAILTGALVAQNLAFGSIPRYAIPLLPFLFLLAARAAFEGAGRGFAARAAAIFALELIVLARAPELSSWDWGQIEAAGVTIEQPIPRGRLPQPGRAAVLHLRIAAPVPSGGAHFVLSVGARTLYRSADDPDRTRAIVTAALPDDVLRENAAGPVTLRLASLGSYGPDAFVLFPVVPPPWRTPARRAGSLDLSPGSDVHSGSLDWWAHPERVSAAGRP